MASCGFHRASATDELITFRQDIYSASPRISRADGLGIILLGSTSISSIGDEVRRTQRVSTSPVGEALLGRVVDGRRPPARPQGAAPSERRWPIERPAPADHRPRARAEPLQTGIKAIDAAIPIGRGQRELILGDRQTGKTAIALDAIINQRGNGIDLRLLRHRPARRRRGPGDRGPCGSRARSSTASWSSPPAKTRPACSSSRPMRQPRMAEFFMEQGRDVLIVYDDLTRHARAYRELSLLLRRPPGREAYPGDIFYIHSRLLERATHLREEQGGGSLTALPIIETEGQNISAYIPTNLISITDGQIYLSPELFRQRPAAGDRYRQIGLAGRRQGAAPGATARSPAICASPMRSSRSWRRSPASARGSTRRRGRAWSAAAACARCSSSPRAVHSARPSRSVCCWRPRKACSTGCRPRAWNRPRRQCAGRCARSLASCARASNRATNSARTIATRFSTPQGAP